MKRYILLPLLAIAFTTQAQDTYMNERLTNNSGEVIGTARYVGMGGALGALGADMSVISWNPAGIGLYRKHDVAFTFGGTWGKSSIVEENRGKGTIDQAGFVFNIKTGNETCPYLNLAFNYQKKLNYNQNFYADNNNLYGLSQMDQVAELTDWDQGWQENLAGMALENGYFSTGKNANGEEYHYNRYPSSANEYTHHSEGSLKAIDLNMSTNIKNRAFIGLTIGVDNLNYNSWTYYREYDMDGYAKYDLNNDYRITGTGVNVKLGTIVRPFENKPFRFAFVVETPTWFRLTNSTLFDLSRGDHYGGTRIDPWESYLKFNLRSPWKVRTGIGSTVGSVLAWDIDYEFAAYAGTHLGYPNDDSWDGAGNIKDVAMNQFTRDILRGTHTLRTGIEVNATKSLAFRVGYNLSTSAYEKNIGFDQYDLNSATMDYATSTNYMRLGNTNILTLGMGYRYKKFYVDLSYKIRNQKGDFYAFDTSFAQGDTQFTADNPELSGLTIDPVGVDLTRQTITCTLGFKF